MKIVGVIPARYASSRFPGKPLADIHGKPMIWWVYQQVKKVREFVEVYVATEDERIADVCLDLEIPFLMTSKSHETSTDRVNEVAQKISADIYVCVNGDEPMIDPEVISKIIPDSLAGFFAANLMTAIANPAEVVDNTNIKVVANTLGDALFMSRSPIPYPKANIDFKYYKHLGVLAYTKDALRFFSETQKGRLEKIEDIDGLRFIEHGKALKMIDVNSISLSVDMPKDLDYVRLAIQKMKLVDIADG